jgi:hypothetical protein
LSAEQAAQVRKDADAAFSAARLFDA